MQDPTPFPVTLAHAIAEPTQESRWLIEGLWGFDAVGILGGEPKCCKSLCALTIAVAVASGTTCLGGRRPLRTGTVLLFAAEDALTIVRDRLGLLSAGMGASLAELPIQVITIPSLRLDSDADCERLTLTVAAYAPVLLILDPFVRLHRVDENVAGEVAPILDYLRRIQRLHGCAILVVHHARKGASHLRAGQALRGSSEFHAWGDSNLFLRRQQDVLTLDIEHRAAPAPDPIRLSLIASDQALHLQAEGESAVADDDAIDHRPRLLAIIGAAAAPMSRREIQAALHLRSATVGALLDQLQEHGRLVRDDRGYRLVTADPRAADS